MDSAYSKEYQNIIDAEKAYELYWEGFISNKKAFTCPEPDCEAKVTCSNIDKERRLLKQKPHFRCYGEHKKGCPNDEYKNIVDAFDDGEERKNNRYIDPKADVLLLKRKEKSSETMKKKTYQDFDHNRIKRKIKNDIEANGKRKSEYVTIMPIVTKYQSYLEQNTTLNHFIENQGKNISYKEMFIKLDTRDFSWFTNFNRVYFGKAKIKKVKNKEYHFRIVFTDEIKYNGVAYKPSAYISSKIIDNSYRNKKWLKELNEIQQSGEEIIVFIYGRVKINNMEEKNYFNIEICEAKLDFMDLRHIE